MKNYLNTIHRELSLYATWLPTDKLNLGDIGVMKNRSFIPGKKTEFSYLDTISSLGIQIQESEKDPREDDAFSYVSKKSVTITMKGKADVAPKGSTLASGDAGFVVDFQSEKAILFK